jgi:nucleotide-binding universal stress UspA family protein
MFRHLLVPTDGSELSQLAVDQAVQMASEIDAKITFFHVQPSYYGRPDVALYGEGLVLDPLMTEQFSKANADYAESVLGAAKAKASATGVEADGATSVNAVIYEAILEAASDHQCDLIFMASHGRRGLAGLVLGSETQRVLTHAELPVLVYPGRGQD